MNEAEQLIYIQMIADDRDSIAYRPRLARMLGGVLPAILLQQMIYWWSREWTGHEQYTPFYKFNAPCRHAKYKLGDSWQESLAFNRTEYTNAIRAIGWKIKRSNDDQVLLEQQRPIWSDQGVLLNAPYLVLYWTDINRMTWHTINRVLFSNAVKQHYLLHDPYIRKSTITTLGNVPSEHYMNGAETTPETPTETTPPPPRARENGDGDGDALGVTGQWLKAQGIHAAAELDIIPLSIVQQVVHDMLFGLDGPQREQRLGAVVLRLRQLKVLPQVDERTRLREKYGDLFRFGDDLEGLENDQSL